jgi:hypothetical protein
MTFKKIELQKGCADKPIDNNHTFQLRPSFTKLQAILKLICLLRFCHGNFIFPLNVLHMSLTFS